MQNWDRRSLQPARKHTIEKKGNLLSAAERAFQRCARRDYRIQLEKDVLALRTKLRHEVDTRRALERAFRRTLGVLPRFSPGLSSKVRELLAEVAVLEEEVISLEECIVALRQELYNEAVNLTASKMPTEPSAESELPTNNCTLGPTRAPQIRSLQNEVRSRRDSVIARLLPPVVGSKMKECTSKVRSVADDKPNNLEKLKSQKPPLFASKQSCSNVLELSEEVMTPRGTSSCHAKNIKTQEISLEKENQLKMPDKMDHTHVQRSGAMLDSMLRKLDKSPKVASSRFNQIKETVEPNLLSEEMVWCLSSVFLRLTKQGSLLNCETASTVSRSTVSSIWSFTSRNTTSYNPSSNVTEEIEFVDPYRICGGFASPDIGPYQYYQEISTGSLDYSKIPRSAALLKKLMCLVEKLKVVDLRGLTHQQKLSFWINIYNACIMHGFLEHGIPNNPNQVVALMRKAVINVGGHVLSALAIEHFILRLPCDSVETSWKKWNRDTEAWMRCSYGLEWPEPLVSFALCCGSWSSPAVRIYTPLGVENELEIAKAEYLQAAVGVTLTGICIPKMLDWSIQKCLANRQGKEMAELVQVMPYDFTFRYLLALQMS
ncbi:hypothetical protein GOP47_0027215 [Adiantum capillus-veneris]|nr:hypothetical protein GOP47_0027215 [Adiantum capillus-veneris]